MLAACMFEQNPDEGRKRRLTEVVALIDKEFLFVDRCSTVCLVSWVLRASYNRPAEGQLIHTGKRGKDGIRSDSTAGVADYLEI